MAILACAVALARDTTGHDWYAAARLTAAELLIAVASTRPRLPNTAPRRAPSRPSAVRVSRSPWRRGGAGGHCGGGLGGGHLGALSGLGGALLCLVLIRRPEGRVPRTAPRIRAGARAAPGGAGEAGVAAREAGSRPDSGEPRVYAATAGARPRIDGPTVGIRTAGWWRTTSCLSSARWRWRRSGTSGSRTLTIGCAGRRRWRTWWCRRCNSPKGFSLWSR